MPIDPSIALQGRPLEIAPPDWNKTYLTLAQLGYLGAEGEKARAGAALTKTQNQQALATLGERQALLAAMPGILAGQGQVQGNIPLATLTPDSAMPPPPQGVSGAVSGRGAPGPGAGGLPPSGAGMPPGQSPGPAQGGGPPQAQARPDILTMQQRILAVAPNEGRQAAQNLGDFVKQDLENQAKVLETSKGKLAAAFQYLSAAKDDAGYQLAKHYSEGLGADTSRWPATYNKPVVDQLLQMNRTEQQKVDERQKNIELGIQQQEANTKSVLAGVATAAEAREAQRIAPPVPMAEGGPYLYKEFGGQPVGVAPGTGMTLPQSQARAGQEAELSGQFRGETQQYDRIRTGLALVRNASDPNPKDPIANDQMLLNGFSELITGGANPRLATVMAPEQRNSLLGKLQQYLDQLSSGASLEPEQRRQIIKASEEIAATHIDTYNKIKAHYDTRASGIPNVRPNAVTQPFLQPTAGTAVQTTTPGSPQGRVVTARGASGATPEEVSRVLAFAASQGEKWSLQRVRDFIKHAKENQLKLPGDE